MPRTKREGVQREWNLGRGLRSEGWAVHYLQLGFK